MRNFVIALTTAAAALGVAAPASAQYYQPTYGYQQPAYGNPYNQPNYGYQYGRPAYGYQYAQPGYGYGYNQPYGYQASSWLYNFRDNRYASMMQERVSRVRNDIRQMSAVRALSWSEARTLDASAINLQNKIAYSSRNGVSNNEARNIDYSLRRLEERVMQEARDNNNRPNTRRYYTYNYNNYWNRYRGY